MSGVLHNCGVSLQILEAHPVIRVRRYSRPVIDLGSIAGLHEHGHQLACHRVRCDRWALLHLAAMIDAVYGEPAVDTARARPSIQCGAESTSRNGCAKCDEPGHPSNGRAMTADSMPQLGITPNCARTYLVAGIAS